MRDLCLLVLRPFGRRFVQGSKEPCTHGAYPPSAASDDTNLTAAMLGEHQFMRVPRLPTRLRCQKGTIAEWDGRQNPAEFEAQHSPSVPACTEGK